MGWPGAARLLQRSGSLMKRNQFHDVKNSLNKRLDHQGQAAQSATGLDERCQRPLMRDIGRLFRRRPQHVTRHEETDMDDDRPP